MLDYKASKLEQAIKTLEYAKYQIKEALGNSDSYQDSAKCIDQLIEDLDCDIVFLCDGEPR